jgi:hypothetical protein
MSKKKAIQMPWVVKDGSIFTEGTVEMRSEFPGNKTTYQVPVAIAFNIGEEVARHIVELHNKEIQP